VSRIILSAILAIILGYVPPAPAAQGAEGIAASRPRRVSDAQATDAQVIWRDPGAVDELDFVNGPGGPEGAPVGPFTFVEEDDDGTSPKIEVTDANGVTWKVKWGEEVNSEVIATRLVWAVGYFVEPAYFVRSGRIEGARDLGRADEYVDDGSFSDARFELKEKGVKRLKDEDSWSWRANPFAGTEELNGLKIMIMLTSNWDSKDAAEGGPSNTAILNYKLPGGGVESRYIVSDWGGSFGKWGGVGRRSKWDCEDYTEQSREFVDQLLDDDTVDWGYRSIRDRTRDITEGIHVSDVAWLMQYLGRVTDAQIAAGLEASGATPEQVECFTQAIRSRINRLNALVVQARLRDNMR
jgi:hypothetical protein